DRSRQVYATGHDGASVRTALCRLQHRGAEEKALPGKADALISRRARDFRPPYHDGMILLVALLCADGDLPARLRDDAEIRVPLYATQADGYKIDVTLAAQARVSIPFGVADS